MNKKIVTVLAIIPISIVFSGCGVKQPTPTVTKQVKVIHSVSPSHKYIYSNKHVEYADVVSIERLKKATVLLIEKVNSFEKILETEIPNNKDMVKFRKSIYAAASIRDQKLIKQIENLKKIITKNSKRIEELELKARTTRPLHRVETYTQKYKNSSNSKYDKKIIEFLNSGKKQ
ncbi:hypothetical protein [Sulfurimonas sp.]